MKTILNTLLVIGLAAFAPLAAQAQDDVPPPMPAAPTFTPAQLDQLMGPVALYPDPLIAVLMPAATLPTQIVEADRYISNGGDPNAVDQQGWDPNVQALAHYPDVLKWMDDNLNWTTQVGQAFQGQQQDVMDSVQRLRTEAYNLGNLQSTPQQQVVDDNGYIEIIPANPDDLYVPDYQPQQVYYDEPSGPPYITFSVGFIIGPWLCGDFDWWHHRVVYWDHDHPRPSGWWHQSPRDRANYFSGHVTTTWNAANRPTLSGYHGADRGYTQDQRTWSAPTLNRPAPQPTERFAPAEQRSDSVWNQNANDARASSERGGESTHTETHSSFGGASNGGFRSSGGGGGGGFHSSGGGGGGNNGGRH
jgi:hypothetical protein